MEAIKRLKILRRSTKLPGESYCEVFRDQGRAMTDKDKHFI
jgi:hypothetical protein